MNLCKTIKNQEKQIPVLSILICVALIVFVHVYSDYTTGYEISDATVPLSAGSYSVQGVAKFSGEIFDIQEHRSIITKVDYSLTNKGLIKIEISEDTNEEFYVSILSTSDKAADDGDAGYSDYQIKKYHQNGVYALTRGPGEYELIVWTKGEKTGEKRHMYASVYRNVFTADFHKNEPYKYSNAYSIFDENSAIAARAHALVADMDDDKKKAKVIIDFVYDNIKYDETLPSDEILYMKADDILESGTGLCYHFTSLAASMLKSVGIPARDVYGYYQNDNNIHSWLEILVDGEWMAADPTRKNGFPISTKNYYPLEYENPLD